MNCLRRADSADSQKRSEGVAYADIKAVARLNLGVFCGFKVGVEVEVVGSIDIRTDAVFEPCVAEVFGERAGYAVLRICRFGVALPVMQDGRADIGIAAVVRALHPECKASTADQRIRGSLIHLNAERRGVIGVKDMAVHDFDLRLDKERVLHRIEAPASFGGHRHGIRVIAA